MLLSAGCSVVRFATRTIRRRVGTIGLALSARPHLLCLHRKRVSAEPVRRLDQ